MSLSRLPSAREGRFAGWTAATRSGLPALVTLILFLACPLCAISGDAIYVGDTVVTVEDRVELGLRDQIAVVLDVGSELRVTEIRGEHGEWIGGYTLIDGERYTGWVRRREVRLRDQDLYPVAPLVPPDENDDPESIEALQELGVELLRNADGQVLSAYATDSDLDDDGVVHFEGLPRLMVLDLSERPLTDQAFQTVTLPETLQELYLNDTRVGDASLERFSELAHLEILTLANTQVTGAGLERLTNLPHLEVLNLGGCDIDDPALEILAEMPQLEVLVLARTQVTSDGLHHLAAITQLRVLNLIGCPIDDAGLVELQPLENLRMLYVEETEVSHEGMEALYENSPSLAIFD